MHSQAGRKQFLITGTVGSTGANAIEIARSIPTLHYGNSVEVRPILAEFPIFQRHPERVKGANKRATEQRWVAVAA
jgi:hypothetical protein